MLEVSTVCGASFQVGCLSIVEEMRRSTLCPRCKKHEEITSVKPYNEKTGEVGSEMLPVEVAE